MARRNRKNNTNNNSSNNNNDNNKNNKPPASTPAPAEEPIGAPAGLKRFERPLPQGSEGMNSSRDVILAREMLPQDTKNSEYLKERAISALLELERRAYKNFEEAVALAQAAAQATDALLDLSVQEGPSSSTKVAEPLVVEEPSSSSDGSKDFEGFLQELLRLLSIDFASDLRGPQQKPQQPQPQQQHKTLQRLDLLQRLASTEPKDIKEALLVRDKGPDGAQRPNCLERLSSGESSEALHLSLLEKLSFRDAALDQETAKGNGSVERPPAKKGVPPVKGEQKKGRPHPPTIRQQLAEQEEPSEGLHLSLLERIGSLPDLPEGIGGSEALHLSLLFGRTSQEDVGSKSSNNPQDTPSDTGAGKKQQLKTGQPAKNVPTQTSLKANGNPQVAAVQEGSAAARQQFRARAPWSSSSGSSCSGSSSSSSMDWVTEALPHSTGREAPFPATPSAAPMTPRGRNAPVSTSNTPSPPTSAAVSGVKAQVKQNPQQQLQPQQKQQQQQQAAPASSISSALRSTSPMPEQRKINDPTAETAPSGPNLCVGVPARAPVGTVGASPMQSAAAGSTRDRRPASAVPQSNLSPQAFWDQFYERTARKMLTDAPAGLQASPAAVPRPATPSPKVIRTSQGTERKKGAWVWMESESSLDVPCPGGCGSQCDERPYDADSSASSSRDSFLVVRGAPLLQQRQQEVCVRVAGPVEKNGRPPLLLQGSIPMAPQAAFQAPDSTRPQDQRPQQQQQQQQQLGSPCGVSSTPRRKNRSRRKRSACRQRR